MMAHMTRFKEDVNALTRDSDTAPNKQRARWELVSCDNKTREVVLRRIDTTDGFTLHCKVSTQYPTGGQTVYSYRTSNSLMDPYQGRERAEAAARRRSEHDKRWEERQRLCREERARRRLAEKELLREELGESGGQCLSPKENEGGSLSSGETSSSCSSRSENASSSSDEYDEEYEAPLPLACSSRLGEVIDKLLDHFYSGKAYAPRLYRVREEERPSPSITAGKGNDGGVTQRPPIVTAAVKKMPPAAARLIGGAASPPAMPRRPVPSTLSTSATNTNRGPNPTVSTSSSRPPGYLEHLDMSTNYYDYSHIYSGENGGTLVGATRVGGNSSAAAARARADKDQMMTTPDRPTKGTAEDDFGFGGRNTLSPTTHSPFASPLTAMGDAALSSVASKHFDEIQRLCAQIGRDAFCTAHHDPARQRFIVDIGVSLRFMPSLRCRAIGLNRKNILVTRLSFPAAAAGGWWTGHEAVKVEKVFMCPPTIFGQIDADVLALGAASNNTAALSAASGEVSEKVSFKTGTDTNSVVAAGGGDGSTSHPLSTASAAVAAAQHTLPVPWYMRTRVQDAITRNQLALQKVEVLERDARVKAIGQHSSSSASLSAITASLSERQSRHAALLAADPKASAAVDLLFKTPEERFFNSPNLFKGIHHYISYRLDVCTAVCLVCDEPLGFAGSKVGICLKDLCQHTSQQFGINTDIITELTENGVVCELLLNLTRAAATSGSTRDTFDPMCPVHITLPSTAALQHAASSSTSPTTALVPQYMQSYLLLKSASDKGDKVGGGGGSSRSATPSAAVGSPHSPTAAAAAFPSRPTHFYVDTYGNGAKDFNLLCAVIDSIPPVADLVANARGSASRLREYLNRVAGPLAYPLLQWVISSNHAHLELVPKEHQMANLGTEHQFYLVGSNPQKERLFREAKRRAQQQNPNGVGSLYAWHGSGAGNWHCILRNGLKNYSGTKLMSTGQIYGAGVYFAKSLATSMPYMGHPQKGWANSKKIAWQLPAASQMNESSSDKNNSALTATAAAASAAAASSSKDKEKREGILVISLCEVVKASTGWKDHENNIITVQDENLINTRFLFVYATGQPSQILNVPLDRLKIPVGIFDDD